MRKLAGIAALVAAAVGAKHYLMLRRGLAEVAPELRSPLLPLVSVPYTAKTLPLIRPLYRLKRRPGPGVTVRTHYVGPSGMRVLVVTPDHRSGPLPAVLMLHAGGTIVGSPQVELGTYGRMAREGGLVVVSPDYRLSPENAFPAALDDSMTTLEWMRERAAELGIAAERMAVGGTSAGGGLAAALAQRCYDEGMALQAQALVYPMLDDRTVLSSDAGGRGRFVWTVASNRFAWTAYLGREPRMSDAPRYAAPARREDLSELPPAWVGVGDLDLFYPEDVAYAKRLRECGVPCELVAVPGMYHAADGYAAKAGASERFIASMIEHLRAHV